MTSREQYAPGPAHGAQIRKERGQNREDKWTLILVRELRHSPEKVWQALTDPAHLREWAPFDADGSLGTAGAKVKLTTVAAPALHVTETTVTRVPPPRASSFHRMSHQSLKRNNKELSPEQRKDLLRALKARFEKNMNRHPGLEWAQVQAKLVKTVLVRTICLTRGSHRSMEHKS